MPDTWPNAWDVKSNEVPSLSWKEALRPGPEQEEFKTSRHGTRSPSCSDLRPTSQPRRPEERGRHLLRPGASPRLCQPPIFTLPLGKSSGIPSSSMRHQLLRLPSPASTLPWLPPFGQSASTQKWMTHSVSKMSCERACHKQTDWFRKHELETFFHVLRNRFLEITIYI